MPHRVLIVDDEESICWGLSKLCDRIGVDSDTAASAEQGLEQASKTHFDLVILDVRLPGMDGLTTVFLFFLDDEDDDDFFLTMALFLALVAVRLEEALLLDLLFGDDFVMGSAADGSSSSILTIILPRFVGLACNWSFLSAALAVGAVSLSSASKSFDSSLAFLEGGSHSDSVSSFLALLVGVILRLGASRGLVGAFRGLTFRLAAMALETLTC